MLRQVAARRLDQLDALSPDLGAQIRELQEYDFLEPEARAQFDALVKRLQGQVLDQYVAGMSDAIRSMTPEDLSANREMVRDLNELIRERIGGADPDASAFLAKHARFFPGAKTFDDIINQGTRTTDVSVRGVSSETQNVNGDDLRAPLPLTLADQLDRKSVV